VAEIYNHLRNPRIEEFEGTEGLERCFYVLERYFSEGLERCLLT